MRKNTLIFLMIALVIFVLSIQQKIKPESFIEETIIRIINDQTDNIHASKDFIRTIKSYYTFNEENGYQIPDITIIEQGPVEGKLNDFYNVLLLSYKYANDGSQIDYRELHLYVEIKKEILEFYIVDFRVLEKS